jgi:hypothetical protein
LGAFAELTFVWHIPILPSAALQPQSPKLDNKGEETQTLSVAKRQDFYYQGPSRWLRFHEKGGKEHEMPAHHEIEETIDEYLSKVGIEGGQPLFQSVNKAGTELSGRALNRHNAWAAIRKRARNAGFLTPVGCHTCRGTGVTVYDRTKDEITIGEVERIQL